MCVPDELSTSLLAGVEHGYPIKQAIASVWYKQCWLAAIIPFHLDEHYFGLESCSNNLSCRAYYTRGSKGGI
jgi:hypothetical protein